MAPAEVREALLVVNHHAVLPRMDFVPDPSSFMPLEEPIGARKSLATPEPKPVVGNMRKIVAHRQPPDTRHLAPRRRRAECLRHGTPDTACLPCPGQRRKRPGKEVDRSSPPEPWASPLLQRIHSPAQTVERGSPTDIREVRQRDRAEMAAGQALVAWCHIRPGPATWQSSAPLRPVWRRQSAGFSNSRVNRSLLPLTDLRPTS